MFQAIFRTFYKSNRTMFLAIFRATYKSEKFMIGAIILQIISMVFMWHKVQHLEYFGAGPPLDVRFGYDPTTVYDWIDKLGPEGRRQYIDMVLWDLFPSMQSYTILLGSLLLKEIENYGKGRRDEGEGDESGVWKSELALIFPFAMACDMVETLANGYATREFPNRVDDQIVGISCLANQLKWVSLVGGMMMLTFLFVSNRLFQKEEDSGDKKKK